MNKVECLDGLRGFAALWVLAGHCMILTGWSLPIIGQPDLGVDLFILLSGFLMVFQARIRSEREDWGRPSTWAAFWVRRVFRIAPLYYVLLAVALLLGPWIYADRVAIDAALGHQVQSPSRYLDAGPVNIWMHLSFLFGLVRSYAFRTPLPDWSIGLEMQFYAAFPFLYLLARRTGWIAGSIVAAGLGLAIALALRWAHITYPMPSLLALKLHLFVAGMLIAAAADRSSWMKAVHLALVMLLTSIPIGGAHGLRNLAIRETLAIGFFALIYWRSVQPIGLLSKLLGSPVAHWLGELSFGVYLFHLLIMHRAAAWAITQPGLHGSARFLVVLGITAPIAYGLAAVTYRFIERPGQAVGKRLIALGAGARTRPLAAG